MNRRDLIRFVDIEKEAERKEKGFSFFDLLDLIDLRDDLKYK